MRSRLLMLALTGLLVLGVSSAAFAAGASRAGGETFPWQRGDVRAAAVDGVGNWTVRIHGANRYATAAAVSEALWSEEYPPMAVYLATGEGYADALAMGASTVGTGPLLLTAKDRLPAETIAELERLRPCFVVAVGGTSVISDSVLRQADRYTAADTDPSCQA